MLIREKLVYECSCSAACALSFLLDVGVYLSLIISFLENSDIDNITQSVQKAPNQTLD